MTAFDVLMIVLFGLSLGRWAVTLVAAIGHHRASRGPRPVGPAPGPLVSVIVPAFNEETLIEGTLRAVADSAYPRLEILLVDDGSTDATRAIAEGLQDDLPGLRLLIQDRNRGKAAALTAGARAANGDIVITVDADTRVDGQAFGHLVQTMLDEGAAAVAGNVKVGNRVNWLTGWQALEYVVGLQLERRAQARLACITTVPGALGAFRKEALAAVGYFPQETLAEDTDLTLTLGRAGARMAFEARAQAWTEAPTRPGGLFRQRSRWLTGNLHCALKHRAAFVEPGHLGLRTYGLPSFWFGHLVSPLLLPLAAFYLLRLLDWFSPAALATGMLLLLCIDLLTAALGLVMDGESAALLPFVPVQRLIYPFFLWFVFLGVCCRALRAVWRRLPREGGWMPVQRRGGWWRGGRPVRPLPPGALD